MAQVRKYDTGGETSPKLLKREGYGDYNVADIESQYAKSLNGILDEMGLEGEDRQKVIETTKNIMSNITNGTINTINSSGQWIVPKEYSSTGYNTYKNAGLFGIKGKKVVRDQNYYNNAAYYILDKVINGTNTYSPKKEDTKEKVNPDQSFEQYLNKYYFNNDKATFDKKLWDYSTAKQGIIDRLKEYRDYISKSDMTDAAKIDYLSRIDSGITGLTDNINTNDYSSLARLGWSKPYMWLDENFDTPPETEKQKAAKEAKETKESIEANTETPIAEDSSFNITWDSKDPNYYSSKNLISLLELLNTGKHNDKIGAFTNSIINYPNKETLPEQVRSWLGINKSEESNQEIEKDGKIHIRSNDFIPYLTIDYNPDNSFLTLFRRQFGIEPSIPIEKGSYQDRRLEYTEELGKKFNENVGDSLINFVKSLFTSYKQPEYVIDKKAKGGNIIKYQNPAGSIERNNGVTYKEGTSWYKDVYLKMRDAMATALSEGKINAKTLNDLQIAHSALWNTASMENRDFYTNPYINTTVGDYQTKFNNLSFGNNIGIKSAFDAGRYNIVSSNPTSGDNPTKKWTVDNKFSGITDDRRVLGRKGDFNPTEELEEKTFWKNKGYNFYLDGDGYYKLTPINNLNTPLSSGNSTESNNASSINNPSVVDTRKSVNDFTGKGAYNTNKDGEIKTPYFDNLLAAGRLAGTLYTNNKVAKTVSESLKLMELTPHRIRRQVRGDLPTRNFYENQAAESNRLGSRPITSDANLQLAQQLMYNDRALKLKMQGFLADKEAIDKTSLLAQQANEQNQANAVDVANKNRASMLGIQQAKANIEASRRSANWQQAWNPYLSTLEQNYKNYHKQLDALNRDVANTVELRKLDTASKQAQNTLDLARTNWLKANTGKSEYDWLNSDEYKNALNDYTEKVTNAGNTYKDTMNKYDLNNLRKPYSFLMFKSGGSTKDIAIENMKELNKTFRKNEELFHKIIMDSKKENNKLIMNLSSLTKELIIKSMTM